MCVHAADAWTPGKLEPSGSQTNSAPLPSLNQNSTVVEELLGTGVFVCVCVCACV